MEDTQFPIVMRGYDRTQVDQKVHSLTSSLNETRSQVATLDSEVLKLSGELAEARRELAENDRPSYSGLGARVERLFVVFN